MSHRRDAGWFDHRVRQVGDVRRVFNLRQPVQTRDCIVNLNFGFVTARNRHPKQVNVLVPHIQINLCAHGNCEHRTFEIYQGELKPPGRLLAANLHGSSQQDCRAMNPFGDA